jgi:tyrosyl-tRNA synthetase
MSTYKSDFLHVLSERGFIHQVSEPEALDALARSSPITGYIGFDCTAASLHIGSLLPIMLLYWLQQTGHRPIALMGGGTTRVGDPSGKDESRRLLTDAAIEDNLKGIRAIFANFLKFTDAGGNAIMANNADWLNTLNYIDFLRDVGRHFSINRMLAFDSVKLRLERQQEMSFLEFNYMILQAYDFVELHRRYGCVLQYRQRHRSRPQIEQRAVLRADRAADHHFVRRQNGQDRGRRGLAQRQFGEPLRLLAILA